MIEDICKWLPPIIKLEDYKGNWDLYNKALYNIFLNDFIHNIPIFKGKKVNIRINPKQNNFEHAFIHLTCKSMENAIEVNDRQPDLRRCERISWNRKIIDNYKCSDNCKNCNKILYYEQMFRNNIRIHLLFADVRFKVVLEKRKSYYLLITGFYIHYNNVMQKELNKYKLFEQQKTPLV